MSYDQMVFLAAFILIAPHVTKDAAWVVVTGLILGLVARQIW